MSRSIKIVFVHGWGMNSAVWESCLESLPEWMQIVLVDLPGHGTMAGNDIGDFNTMVHTLAATTSVPVLWVGWSLGGLVCLRIAELYPEKVLGLSLVTTNPCFIKKKGWDCAVEKSVFDDFSMTLKHDIDKTLRRFLALQVAGSSVTTSAIKTLQNALKSRGHASATALDSGLMALSEIDLRDTLVHLNAPMQWILGSKDTLVPVTLAYVLPTLTPKCELVVIDGAAHAPFISHEEVFTKALIHFASTLRESYDANA